MGVLLKKMMNNKDFIDKANQSPSFENGQFSYQNRPSCPEVTLDEESKKLSPAIDSDDFPRSHSNNIGKVDPYEFNEAEDLDNIILSNLDDNLLDETTSKKKKRNRLTMLRKNVSVIYSKEKKLDGTDELTYSAADGSSNTDSHKKVGTPQIISKKTKKRRKLKNLKNSKGGSSTVTEHDKLDEAAPCKQISLFKKAPNYDMDEDRSFSESPPPKDRVVSCFASKGEPYVFKRDDQFSKSDQFHSKRNSSPLGDDAEDCLIKSSTKPFQKRTNSNSSCSSEFERSEGDNIGSTDTTSKKTKSCYTISEGTPNDQVKGVSYTVSPSGDTIKEASKDEECSPDIRRDESRRDSYSEELAGLRAFFGHDQTPSAKRNSNANPKDKSKF